MNMFQAVVTAIFYTVSVSAGISIVIYIPFFWHMHKHRHPELYEAKGGLVSFVNMGDVGQYLLFGGYKETNDPKIIFHGNILRWTLGYAAVVWVICLMILVYIKDGHL